MPPPSIYPLLETAFLETHPSPSVMLPVVQNTRSPTPGWQILTCFPNSAKWCSLSRPPLNEASFLGALSSSRFYFLLRVHGCLALRASPFSCSTPHPQSTLLIVFSIFGGWVDEIQWVGEWVVGWVSEWAMDAQIFRWIHSTIKAEWVDAGKSRWIKA